MGIVTGVIKNKKGQVIEGVAVALKDEEFVDVASTKTNERGEYILNVKNGYYPYIYAVKDYAKNYLEFWGQNINVRDKIIINASIDKLEIYGLHCFRVKGGYPALTVYFRPMSLDKFLKGEEDISPNMTDESISVWINDEEQKILSVNRVQEYVGDRYMRAYLIQVSLPKKLRDKDENLLDVKILDLDEQFGQASIFF